MANVYLEKIAFLAEAGGLLMDGVAKGGKAIGRVAVKGAKAFGNQVHLSMGGANIDHARNVLGVKDPYKLADAADPKILRKMHVTQALKGNRKFGDIKGAYRDFDKNVAPGLKRKQRNARITLGAIGAGTAYTGYKVKEKMDEPKVQSYDYY